MKKSYDFWHQIYDDSPINIPLIWKKALESNSEFAANFKKAWDDKTKKTEFDLQQFLEMWSDSIRESDFKKATKSISQYCVNVSDSQTKLYLEVLEMLERYWRNIQDKNIE
ncbi:MAG: hypothetical protein PVI88_04355 [Nitrosopumilaceae archaeon]